MSLWRWWMTYLATIPAQFRASNRWLDPAWKPRRRMRRIKLIPCGKNVYVSEMPTWTGGEDHHRNTFWWSVGV